MVCVHGLARAVANWETRGATAPPVILQIKHLKPGLFARHDKINNLQNVQ